MAELFDMKKGAMLLEIITKVRQCQFAKIALQYVHDFDISDFLKMKNKRKWSC
jgi:hypothetical protein